MYFCQPFFLSQRRTTGDQPQEIEWATGGRSSVDGASIVQKELNETIVRSREEIEERLETEDRQQLGDISDEVYPRDTPTPKFHLRVPWIYTPAVCVCARTFSPPLHAAKRSTKRLLSVPKVHPTLARVHYGSFSLFLSLLLSLSLSWKAALPFLFSGLDAKISSFFRPRPILDGLCLPFVASVKIYERRRFLSKCVARRGFLSERRNVFEKRWLI